MRGAAVVSTCYTCGGYVYGTTRHRTCEPRYRRHRFGPCIVCGRISRGLRHVSCVVGLPEFANCLYCGEPVRTGRLQRNRHRHGYHRECVPTAVDALAMFADMPGIVQRRCSKCGEWMPFAAIDGETAGTFDAWQPKGKSHGKSPYISPVCRACVAQGRREREYPKAKAA